MAQEEVQNVVKGSMRTMETMRSEAPLDRQFPRGAGQDGGALGLIRRLAAALAWLDDRVEKRRSRRALLELSDYQLKDIGLSRADAFNEARRRFWD